MSRILRRRFRTCRFFVHIERRFSPRGRLRRALPSFKGLDVSHLRDHLLDLLDQLDAWLERAARKAGHPTDKPLPAASAHALDRLELGLDLKTLVYEYRLLRRAISDSGTLRGLKAGCHLRRAKETGPGMV